MSSYHRRGGFSRSCGRPLLRDRQHPYPSAQMPTAEAAAARTAAARTAETAGNRLYEEGKARRARQARRAQLSRFTFRPTLTSGAGREGAGQTQRNLSGEAPGERLFRQAEKQRRRAEERAALRARQEVVDCTFKPRFVTSKHRPTKMAEPQSSPRMFRRRVKRIFAQIDEDKSGLIDLREFKKAMVGGCPELSEIIAPARAKKAYDGIAAQAAEGGGVAFDTFLQFCTDAASLRNYDTFERRCRLVFEKIDVDDSGRISKREIRKALVNVPELSEMIAPGRTEDAFKELTTRAQAGSSSGGGGGKNENGDEEARAADGGPNGCGGATFQDFLVFCRKGASLVKYEGSSPLRSGERMYRQAAAQRRRKDKTLELHAKKRVS